MKKTLLALAITALSANTFAADINYALPSPVVNTVAKEVVAGTAGTVLTTDDVVTFPLGFSITAQNLVRIDLSNGAKFKNAPSLVTTSGISATTTIAAGGAGATYVIFQFDVGSTSAAADNNVLTLDDLTIASQADVTLQYRLYSTQPDAVAANANTVASGSYAYLTFANGLVFNADSTLTAASKQIDVRTASKKFENGTLISTPFGGLNLSVKPATYGDDLNAAALTLTDMVGTNAIVTVTGDYSAKTATATDQKLAALSAATATATATTYNLGAVTATPLAAAKLTYQVNGTTAMASSAYNAKLTLGGGALVTTAPADVTSFANLSKNSASEEVNLALNPSGVYSNFIRISNTSTIAGDVFLTVINDSGASAAINLQDIAGQTGSNVLNAGASTTQISIQDIFAAASAKGLVLTGQNKLRLVVDAQVPTIDVQSITTSKDQNSFSTFN